MQTPFNFTLGQLVMWLNGCYDYYRIAAIYQDNGIKYCDLINPNGIEIPSVKIEQLLSI